MKVVAILFVTASAAMWLLAGAGTAKDKNWGGLVLGIICGVAGIVCLMYVLGVSA